VGFAALPQAMAGVGRLKSIRKGACRVAGAVQETSPSDMKPLPWHLDVSKSMWMVQHFKKLFIMPQTVWPH
jgi:hypothetical protein